MSKYIINYAFKQILKYIILKRWENFGSFGFQSVGFVCQEKPKVLKCAAGFQLVGNLMCKKVLILKQVQHRCFIHDVTEASSAQVNGLSLLE
tara:strand:+ start:2547 stop:2822 length:276 start_codon:yes stop_codon:yes gene_type:complete